MDSEKAIDLIIKEFNEATKKFGKFNSTHEGYAVILEELDELWVLIKANQTKEIRAKEAKLVAAMAFRFLVDCC